MLGDNNYNNNKNKFQPTVYSGYTFPNNQSDLDPTKLSFSFWNKLLKISIAPYTGSPEQNGGWDYKNEGSAYISILKARLLANEIILFLEDPETYSNMGVPTKDGLICISNGREISGKFAPCIIIKSFNEEGAVTSSYLYEFRKDHYTIRNFSDADANFDKKTHEYVEIYSMLTLLEQYYQAMTGAMAYSVISESRFGDSRVNTKLDSICEKLGIEYKKGGNYSKGGNKNSSVFDSKPARNYDSRTLDDIESEM